MSDFVGPSAGAVIPAGRRGAVGSPDSSAALAIDMPHFSSVGLYSGPLTAVSPSSACLSKPSETTSRRCEATMWFAGPSSELSTDWSANSRAERQRVTSAVLFEADRLECLVSSATTRISMGTTPGL